MALGAFPAHPATAAAAAELAGRQAKAPARPDKAAGRPDTATAGCAAEAAAGSARATRRAADVARFLELRPAVLARMRASIPDELRAGFDSVTPRQLQALALLPGAGPDDEPGGEGSAGSGDGPAAGMDMHRLAAALGITAPTASTMASRLVSAGLAERLPSPSDRRVVRLALTERGRDLARRYHQIQRQGAGAIFDLLTETQARSLLGLMEILAEGGQPAEEAR